MVLYFYFSVKWVLDGEGRSRRNLRCVLDSHMQIRLELESTGQTASLPGCERYQAHSTAPHNVLKDYVKAFYQHLPGPDPSFYMTTLSRDQHFWNVHGHDKHCVWPCAAVICVPYAEPAMRLSLCHPDWGGLRCLFTPQPGTYKEQRDWRTRKLSGKKLGLHSIISLG